jgi:hypothetical protein
MAQLPLFDSRLNSMGDPEITIFRQILSLLGFTRRTVVRGKWSAGTQAN